MLAMHEAGSPYITCSVCAINCRTHHHLFSHCCKKSLKYSPALCVAPPRRAAASVYLSEACRQLQTYSFSCKCRKSRPSPSTKCSPTCPCAECTLSSLPPLSGGFASQGPASAAGAFLWCRCSNTALRSFSWFLREVVFELLLFLRASSAPLCVVVACTLVLMCVASSPPPTPHPAARSHSRE
jgi:hypothetical protein